MCIRDRHFPLIDIGIAAAHISLAAEAEGLGSCILGWFDEKELKQLEMCIRDRLKVILRVVDVFIVKLLIKKLMNVRLL